MRDPRQLDLFDWRPPCQVVPFPCDRLIGRARHILRHREVASHGAMDHIWKWELRDLDTSLGRAGFPDMEREHQVNAFIGLVRREITRQKVVGPSVYSDGDAA